MSDPCDIGLIGLAVMGENLALNIESRAYRVAVYNRTVEKVDDFIQGRAAGKAFVPRDRQAQPPVEPRQPEDPRP